MQIWTIMQTPHRRQQHFKPECYTPLSFSFNNSCSLKWFYIKRCRLKQSCNVLCASGKASSSLENISGVVSRFTLVQLALHCGITVCNAVTPVSPAVAHTDVSKTGALINVSSGEAPFLEVQWPSKVCSVLLSLLQHHGYTLPQKLVQPAAAPKCQAFFLHTRCP